MNLGKATTTAAFAALAVFSAHAQDASPKWGPHIDFEGKAGTKRNLGEGDLFAPLAQNDDTLLFADLRARMDDQSSREGNFGLGVRHMHESGWNLGGYGFFDRRSSGYDNYFNQATLGAEALSLDWDVRVNGYVPLGDRIKNVESLNSAAVSGTTVIFKGGEEHALGGFDGEIGWRTPMFGADAGRQLRVYLGGYRFTHGGVPTVQGPRARLELTIDEMPELWPGARLTLGAEAQHDTPRGNQGFVSARLRVPFDALSGGAGAKTRTLTAMERRMADPIVRDIDVVTQAGDFGAAETATQTAGGSAITVVNSTTTSGANLAAALVTAGNNSTVILSGTFSTTAAVALQSGQTVMGAGTVTVRSPSGRTATLTTSAATISNTTAAAGSVAAVTLNNNSTLTGMTISQTTSNAGTTLYGVQANNVSGAVISNNTVTSTIAFNGTSGIRVEGTSSNVTVSGNTVTVENTNVGGTAVGMYLQGTSITVVNNSLSVNTGGVNEYAFYRAGALSISSSASTGNRLTQAVTNNCGTGGGVITGTISFTNASGAAATCP